MSKRKIAYLVGALLILGIVNFQIFQKEKVLKEGTLVLLDLAPVDPRSLFQGDYMDLRYKLANSISIKEVENRGFAIVTLDDNGVANLLRTQTENEPLETGEVPIHYFKNRHGISIGAESFFFQEGQAEAFDQARYGALRVEPSGESVLVGLYNQDFQLINPESSIKSD